MGDHSSALGLGARACEYGPRAVGRDSTDILDTVSGCLFIVKVPMEDEELPPGSESEVLRWVRRLVESAGVDRRRAAKKLAHLGISLRGSVRTRGSLKMGARERLNDRRALLGITRCLTDADKSVRC